jgi:hypothetical protein
MVRCIPQILLAVVALCSTAVSSKAQDPEAYCRDAISRAKAFSPSTRGVSEDLYRLGSCGRDGYRAAGEVFSRARSSHDTGLLHQLLEFVSGGDGLLFLDPLLSVAADRGATTEARVTAMVGLIQLQSGVNGITFHDLSVGIENTTCDVGRMVTDQGGHPKSTSADSARIVAVAKQIRADPTAPMEVRTGAACLGG